MTIEAMKQWREALACALSDDKPYIDRCKQAIASIDQAIAEAEKHEVSQEPVACKEDDVGNLEYRGNSVGYIFQKMTAYKKGIGDVWDALKSIGVHPDGKTSAPDAIRNLYTHPQPKREPLTDEQIAEFFGVKAVDESFVDFVRAIEAAHGIKEKNT